MRGIILSHAVMSANQVYGNADTRSTKSRDGRGSGSDSRQTENIPLQNWRSANEASVKSQAEIEKPPQNINGPLWGLLLILFS